jgi:hypothetical protein
MDLLDTARPTRLLGFQDRVVLHPALELVLRRRVAANPRPSAENTQRLAMPVGAHRQRNMREEASLCPFTVGPKTAQILSSRGEAELRSVVTND